MEEIPDIEYTGSTTMEEIRDSLGLISLFLGHIDTLDFETAQKIMFMRLQFESFYKQIMPFVRKLEASEKASSTS